jgi:hypothetical protein
VSALEPAEPVAAAREAPTGIAIVSVGFELPGLFDGQTAVTVVRDVPDDDAVAGLVDVLAAALGRARHVIVVHAEWLHPDVLRRLHTARIALDTDSVALVGCDLPPLAGGVLAATGAALATRVRSAGALAAALPAVGRELVVLAWLRSVSGLRRPSPSMAQHAASLVPGRGFGVQLQPEPFVRKLNPAKEAPIALVPETMELVIADRDGDVDWVTVVVNPALGRLRLSEINPPEHGPTWWATSRLTEIVAHPADLDALARRATDTLTLRRCGWCDARVAQSPCPFCGHVP